MRCVERFEVNEKGRDFVVGDIHGCFWMLEEMFKSIKFDKAADRLFSVGDLVDRGQDSGECVEWISKPWFHAVRGNHEQMAIGVAAGKHDLGNYLLNGGGWFLSLDNPRQKLIAECLDTLPLMIEVKTKTGRIGIVHADVAGTWDETANILERNDISNNQRRRVFERLLWNRVRITGRDTSGVRDVDFMFVGHTPLSEVGFLGNVVYLDTGAVFGKSLSLVDISAPHTVYSVAA